MVARRWHKCWCPYPCSSIKSLLLKTVDRESLKEARGILSCLLAARMIKLLPRLAPLAYMTTLDLSSHPQIVAHCPFLRYLYKVCLLIPIWLARAICLNPPAIFCFNCGPKNGASSAPLISNRGKNISWIRDPRIYGSWRILGVILVI